MAEAGEDRVDSGLDISAGLLTDHGGALPSTSLHTGVFIYKEKQMSVEFIEPYSASHICAKGGHVLREPMQLPCGHLMCKQCVAQISGGGNVAECPALTDCGTRCKTQINTNCVHLDSGVKRELGLLKVKCPFKTQGCNFSTQFRMLEKHLEECEFGGFMKQNNGASRYNGPQSLPETSKTKITIPPQPGRNKMVKNVPLIDHLLARVLTMEEGSKYLDRFLPQYEHAIHNHNDALAKRRKKLEDQDRTVTKMKMSLDECGKKVQFDQQRKLYKAINTSMQAVSQRCTEAERKLQRMQVKETTLIPEEIRLKIISNDKKVHHHNSSLIANEKRLDEFEKSTDSGSLIWRIDGYRSKKASGGCIHSPGFYSHNYGYRLMLELYLNGESHTIGRNTHASLYLKVLPGEYDPILTWPFLWKVTFDLMSQSGGPNHSSTFQPEGSSKCFGRPSDVEQVLAMPVSNSAGFSLFVPHTTLESPAYLKDDVIFIRATVTKPAGSNLHK